MTQRDHRPDWRLALVFGLVLIAAVVGPAVWAWSVADQLPDQVARHWGFDGSVTGVWSLNVQLVMLGATTLLVSGAMGAMAVVGRMPLAIRRMLVGCSVAMAGLLAGLQVVGLVGHLGLDDPYAAPSPTNGVVVGLIVGVVAAVLVAKVARENLDVVRANAPPEPSLPRVPLGQAPVTSLPAPPNRGLLVVGIVVLLATGATSAAAVYWPLVIGVLVYAAIHLHVRFTVTIDHEKVRVGNRVLSMIIVPIEQIAGADTTSVDPLWEFGGWGLRVDTKGRTGVVIRKGEALRMTRGDGSQVLVTVDDAHLAAATINTYADLRFTTRGGSAPS